jgi:NADH-quinone oxidoreductase subunit L
MIFTDPRLVLLIAAVLPLVAAVVLLVATRRGLFRAASGVSIVAVALSWFCTFFVTAQWASAPSEQRQAMAWTVPWLPLGNPALKTTSWLTAGVFVDGLTVALCVLVTTVSLLVHFYSLGYMRADTRVNRYFAYLCLFTSAMLGLLLSSTLLQMFVFWELVGFTSYLLIGFWFERQGPQKACTKAFIMNRVGDAGFLIGLGILFAHVGPKLGLPAPGGMADSVWMYEHADVSSAVTETLVLAGQTLAHAPLWLTVAGIALFCGAIGKSAQFPLQSWLPDAMQGPTPVSAIVHSATMVAAGVYLTARIYPLLTPEAHLFVTATGAITIILGALMALAATDLKRVLAYSTLSQLGYMMLGLGAGAFTFGLYHLVAHAFVKCCLFLCAGSIIQSMGHEQDIRRMGGLLTRLPGTAACFAVASLVIAGAWLPGADLGGGAYYTKEGVLASAVNYGQAMADVADWAWLLYAGPIVGAYLTAFYMARCFALVFMGPAFDAVTQTKAEEPGLSMGSTQAALAVMAVICAPWGQHFWLDLINQSALGLSVQPFEQVHMESGFAVVHRWAGYSWVIGGSLGLALYGSQFGRRTLDRLVAMPPMNQFRAALNHGFYFDALYDVLFVGAVRSAAMVCAWVDRRLVDGAVNLTATLTHFAAQCVGWFDDHVVDDVAVEGTAWLTGRGGAGLRLAQSGRLRTYLLALFFFGAMATLAWLIVGAMLR